MAVHASVLLKKFLESGKPVVTTRELAREGGMTVAEAQEAVLSEAASNGALDLESEAPYELQFTVTFQPAAVDGSTMLVVKRFRSRQDAEACVAQGEGRTMMLHSVTAKSIYHSMTMCQLMEKRSTSHKSQRQSYPLLSRQATIEKSMSSGELVPQSLHPEEKVSAVPIAMKRPSSNDKATSVHKDEGVHKVPAGVAQDAAKISAAGQSIEQRTVEPMVAPAPMPVEVPSGEASSATSAAASAPPQKHEVAPEAAPAPAGTGTADAQPKPRSLLDMLRAPTKRARTEDAAKEGASPKGAPAAPKAPSAAKGKGRPHKETKSLAKLAARNGGKSSTVGATSSLVLDNEDVADSDEERDDDDAKKYLVEMRSTSPPAKRGRARRQELDANLIPCEEDSSAEVEEVAAPEEEFVLCDAATLAREPPIALPAQQQQAPASHSPARPKIAQKRPRDAAPPAPLTGNLNSFFNAELIAFQKQYSREHRTDCQTINGEFFFNDVVFFRHNESKEELSEDEYNARQKEISRRFEQEKAAKKAAIGESTEPTPEGLSQPKPADHPPSPKAPKAPAPVKEKAAAPARAPQKTLFSYFTKKS